MAVTEVIRFDFRTQAVSGIPSGILRPTFLFEHSPPIVERRRPLSPLVPSFHSAGIRMSRHRANCSIARPKGGRRGRFECRRLIFTKRF
jgi:hypothetical protein